MFRLLGLIALVSCLTQSCTISCNCYKECVYFNHDSIEVCTMDYPKGNAFGDTMNSLIKLYGPGRDTILAQEELHGLDTRILENKLSSLESQGYQCPCSK